MYFENSRANSLVITDIFFAQFNVERNPRPLFPIVFFLIFFGLLYALNKDFTPLNENEFPVFEIENLLPLNSINTFPCPSSASSSAFCNSSKICRP